MKPQKRKKTSRMKPQKRKKTSAKKSLGKTVANPRSARNPVSSGALVTIPFEQIQKPELYKGKLSVIKTPFTELQIKHLVAPTPRNIVLKRPGKGGGSWDYIPGWWFRKKMNFTFGFLHDFEILGERVDGNFVTVKGRLTVRDAKGNAIVSKSDFGGAEVKYRKGTKDPLDIPNDFKAAATDCFKRCCVQLGLGLDVYSKQDYQAGDAPVEPVAPAPVRAAMVTTAKGELLIIHECSSCGEPISEQVASYSLKVHKRKLCASCQKAGR